MQNIFIAPAMQHGCRAKPLFLTVATLMQRAQKIFLKINYTAGDNTSVSFFILEVSIS